MQAAVGVFVAAQSGEGEPINHKMFLARALRGKHNKGKFVSIRVIISTARDTSLTLSLTLSLLFTAISENTSRSIHYILIYYIVLLLSLFLYKCV